MERFCEDCCFSDITGDANRMRVCVNSEVLQWHRSRQGSHFTPACSYETGFGKLCGKGRNLFFPSSNPGFPKKAKIHLYVDLRRMQELGKHLGLSEGSLRRFSGSVREVEVEVEVYESGTSRVLSLKTVA